MIDDFYNLYRTGKLHGSWLIDTNNPAKALQELMQFIHTTLFDNHPIALEHNPDFRLVEKEANAHSNNISIEQIRKLQTFLNHTATMFKHKIAVVYMAELMNNYAANSCLKLLEEAPGDVYIFLVTTKPTAMLATIRSRCAKITHVVKGCNNDNEYLEFIDFVLNQDISTKLSLLKKFSDRNRDQWTVFANNILQLMAKIIKKSANIKIELSQEEYKIVQRFNNKPVSYLLNQMSYIQDIIDATTNYDIDIRASVVLLVEQFCLTNLGDSS